MKVENMTYNAKTAFTERREIIDKLNECINSINTYGPEKIKDLESKNVQQDSDIANLKTKITDIETKDTYQDSAIANIETKNVQQDSDIASLKSASYLQMVTITAHETKISNIETKNAKQDDDINDLKNADTNNVKINKINEYAVGLTGNQDIGGIKEFVEPIRGRVTNVLYAEYSGLLPSGKYRQFAKIPATNSDSMIVLDVMCSANGANYGYGRVIIGNPITTSWFCQWVDRELFANNEWLTADVIQIGRDTATGDLMIFAKNPTFTALVVNLVYSKYDSDIQGQAKVEKVANTTDYSLDGTDAGVDNIIPASDTNNVKINKINEYAVGLTGNQNISGVKNFTAINVSSVKMGDNFRPIIVYGNYDPENVTEEIRIRPLTVCPNVTKIDQPIFRIEIFDNANNFGCIIRCNRYNNEQTKEIKLFVRKSDGVGYVTAPSRSSTNITDYSSNEVVTVDTLRKLGLIQ